jgi:general secretion pathway protein H
LTMRHAAGFTLIEILVVLFIVAIMSSVVVAKLPSFAQSGDFDTETQRLKRLLDLLRLESQIQDTEYGFRPSREGYEFMQFDPQQGGWQSLKEKPFGPRKLPADVRLTAKVEDIGFSLGEASDNNRAPPILILSSGEMTPCELTLSQADEANRTLLTDGYGDLYWQDEPDPSLTAGASDG